MKQQILQSERIRLRAVEPGDVEFIHRMENDPEAWRAGNTLVPYSRFQVEQYVLSTRHDLYTERQLRFMIEKVTTGPPGETVGAIDLYDYDPHNRRAGVGILLQSSARGKGLAHEALLLLVKYCFGTLDFHQLYCHISAGNKASVSLFEKAGFIHCGMLREWTLIDGTWTDELTFQLINRDAS
jgi:diamine N-acetyltransferase